VDQVVVGILAEDIPGVVDHCNRLDMIAGVAGFGAHGFRVILYFPNTRDLPVGSTLLVGVLVGVL